jgi:hypothetical protein
MPSGGDLVPVGPSGRSFGSRSFGGSACANDEAMSGSIKADANAGIIVRFHKSLV